MKPLLPLLLVLLLPACSLTPQQKALVAKYGNDILKVTTAAAAGATANATVQLQTTGKVDKKQVATAAELAALQAANGILNPIVIPAP